MGLSGRTSLAVSAVRIALVTTVGLAVLSAGATAANSANSPIAYFLHPVVHARNCEPSVSTVWSVPVAGGAPARVSGIPPLTGAGAESIAASPEGSKLAIITNRGTCGPANLKLAPQQYTTAEGLPAKPGPAYLDTTVTTLTIYDLTGHARPHQVFSEVDKCIIPLTTYAAYPACEGLDFAALHWSSSGLRLTYNYSNVVGKEIIDGIRINAEKAPIRDYNVVRSLSGQVVRSHYLGNGFAFSHDYVSDTTYAAYSVGDSNSPTSGGKIMLGHVGRGSKVLLSRPICFSPYSLALSPGDTSVAFLGWPPARVVLRQSGGQAVHRCAGNVLSTDVAVAGPAGVRIIAKATPRSAWDWADPAFISSGTGLLLFRERVAKPSRYEIWVDSVVWSPMRSRAP